jgi:hypothetical protein
MCPDDDRRKSSLPGIPRAKKDPERSPLSGILEDPSAADHGMASLDKALWDTSRDKSTPEQAAEDDT